MRKFIIDTNSSSEDAIALMMALSDHTCEVCAVTTVMGRVPIELATRNAKCVLERVGKVDVPIYQGMRRPLVRDFLNANSLDNDNDLIFFKPCTPTIETQVKHAVDAIIEWVDTLNGEAEIIALGPLTNIALALRKNPGIMKKVKHIYMVGGAQLGYSGETEVAEFNILADPEAAHIVFSSKLEMTMMPLEVSLKGDGRSGADTTLNENDMHNLININSETSKNWLDCLKNLENYHKHGFNDFRIELPGPTGITIALRPELIMHSYKAQVDVDLSNALSYGQTVINNKGGTVLENQSYFANLTIISALYGRGFKDYLLECVR